MDVAKITFLFALLFCSSASYALTDLRYFTEEYPPYNFTNNGKITGIAVDMLIQANKLVGVETDSKSIKLYPWPRDYRLVLQTPNTVLFSTGRTSAREPLFKWAGPIGDTRIVILAKKSKNIVIKQPHELANFSIGVVRDDIGEQLSLKAGATLRNLEHANTAVPLAKMLHHERIQLWAYEEQVALWSIEKAGIDPNEFEVVYVLETISLYYAFNINTSDEDVKRLQLGIDRLKERGSENDQSEYEKIVSKYSSWK